MCSFFFFFNDTATTEIYTLSLHDALPISRHGAAALRQRNPLDRRRADPEDRGQEAGAAARRAAGGASGVGSLRDRKSTRLNSSHDQISYAVFCLKKKK